MSQTARVKFKSKVQVTDSDPPWHILRVPKKKVEHFGFKGNLRRVVCSLNGCNEFNCSLFPSQGDYFITLSKQLRMKLGVEVGDPVTIELSKDESKYGMPMPPEFAEVLKQDPDGRKLFDELSPGNQRLMLKLIVFVKDVDRRIMRGLAGLELLKRSDGKFEWREQHDTMRAASELGRPK
jgi:hypothetical protein